MLPYNKNLRQHARELRKNMTDAERRLWSKIRMRQLSGHQFYRQKIIGDYIVDFFCPKVKIVIEVYGGQHYSDGVAEADTIRDEYMKNCGLRVLRFANTDVLNNTEGVLERIIESVGVSGENHLC